MKSHTPQELMSLIRPALQDAMMTSCATPEPVEDPQLMQAWWSAVQGRNVQQMRVLIDRGARVNASSPAGKTALSYAAFHGERAMVKLLLSRRADPSVKCAAYGSPLAASLFWQDAAIAQDLLDSGASPNDVDAKGRPVLEVALESRPDVATKLIQAGSKLDWYDEYGRTPLLLALTYGQWKNGLLLLKEGAEVNVANHEGFTPLMLAISLYSARPDSIEIIHALLDAGAQIDACLQSGLTALMFAAVHDSSGTTVELLLKRGASPHVSSESGSVVSLANKMGNERCVALLTEYIARSLHEKTMSPSGPHVSGIRRI